MQSLLSLNYWAGKLELGEAETWLAQGHTADSGRSGFRVGTSDSGSRAWIIPNCLLLGSMSGGLNSETQFSENRGQRRDDIHPDGFLGKVC